MQNTEHLSKKTPRELLDFIARSQQKWAASEAEAALTFLLSLKNSFISGKNMRAESVKTR
jgi:hypothetical protein